MKRCFLIIAVILVQAIALNVGCSSSVAKQSPAKTSAPFSLKVIAPQPPLTTKGYATKTSSQTAIQPKRAQERQPLVANTESQKIQKSEVTAADRARIDKQNKQFQLVQQQPVPINNPTTSDSSDNQNVRTKNVNFLSARTNQQFSNNNQNKQTQIIQSAPSNLQGINSAPGLSQPVKIITISSLPETSSSQSTANFQQSQPRLVITQTTSLTSDLPLQAQNTGCQTSSSLRAPTHRSQIFDVNDRSSKVADFEVPTAGYTQSTYNNAARKNQKEINAANNAAVLDKLQTTTSIERDELAAKTVKEVVAGENQMAQWKMKLPRIPEEPDISDTLAVSYYHSQIPKLQPINNPAFMKPSKPYVFDQKVCSGYRCPKISPVPYNN